MPPALRLIWLHSIARVRAAGFAPWLLFAGWMVVATLQEPRLLRSYGIHLIDDAAWSGGLVLLVVLLLVERTTPRRLGWASNLVVLAAVALLAATAAAAFDRSYWAVGVAGRAWQAAGFVLAWSPLSLVLCRPWPASHIGRQVAILVLLAACSTGSMLAVTLRVAAEPGAVLASVLAVAAAAAWVRPGKTT